MKKAIIAIVSIVLILAAVAVGVTAYASDGYTLPVSEWGERLGIDSKPAEPEQEQPEDATPGGQVPGGDTQQPEEKPDEEVPDEQTPDEEKTNLIWEFTKTYYISESGDETDRDYDSPLKEIFEDMKMLSNTDGYFNITLQDKNAPGQRSESGFITSIQYISGHPQSGSSIDMDMTMDGVFISYTVGNGSSEFYGQTKLVGIMRTEKISTGESYWETMIPEDWASEYGVGWMRITGMYLEQE